jgi:hypothetical protein
MTTRSLALVLSVASSAMLGACTTSATLAPADSTPPIALATELSSTSVLAHVPMQDTARVAGSAAGMVAVVGLLNQTAPCFALSAAAERAGSRVVLRLIATEQPGTCATFAAGAFDYDVGIRGLAAGSYDVDVVHRVVFKDGRVAEAKAGGRRVEVK